MRPPGGPRQPFPLFIGSLQRQHVHPYVFRSLRKHSGRRQRFGSATAVVDLPFAHIDHFPVRRLYVALSQYSGEINKRYGLLTRNLYNLEDTLNARWIRMVFSARET
ncbi:Uncharacterized protein HZ326_25531 [Fusarium oxysporum f. sp. albedinis]|nr:Uncharacterized protein HZ326_25531 [Fusarium oxysporum f. sp. albedinis]